MKMSDTKVRKAAVETLRRGDLIDLQNDPYADPVGDEVSYEFSYGMVEDVAVVTEGDTEVVKVTFIHDGWDNVIAFPKGHELTVGERD
jgi:hypothetical protein